MRMHQGGQLLRKDLAVDSEVPLGQQFGGPRPDDVDAEDRPVVLGDNFDDPLRLTDDQRRPLPMNRWVDVRTS